MFALVTIISMNYFSSLYHIVFILKQLNKSLWASTLRFCSNMCLYKPQDPMVLIYLRKSWEGTPAFLKVKIYLLKLDLQ